MQDKSESQKTEEEEIELPKPEPTEAEFQLCFDSNKRARVGYPTKSKDILRDEFCNRTISHQSFLYCDNMLDSSIEMMSLCMIHSKCYVAFFKFLTAGFTVAVHGNCCNFCHMNFFITPFSNNV